MSRPQAQKLRDAGIATLASLAALPDDARVPRVAPATVAKLRRQAALQLARRSGGAPVVEQLDMEDGSGFRSEEHTTELQSLMRISYAVFCLTKQKQRAIHHTIT